MSLKLSVIGTGYLGAVHATALASVGFEVVGIDQDLNKIKSLQSGIAPFYEPEFDELLEEELRSQRLVFGSNYQLIENCDVHFICVGTPQKENSNSANLEFVENSFTKLLKHAKKDSLIVGKSTVPVGTANRLTKLMAQTRPDLKLSWNPEFLREGFAVEDTLRPTRIVVGVQDKKSEEILRTLYKFNIDDGIPFLVTDLATAELVKAAANSFLATKISFINTMSEICEATGGNVQQLAKAIGLDPRIGEKFLGAGIGFGGGCLPKDIRAFANRSEELGITNTAKYLNILDQINIDARNNFVKKIKIEFADDLKSKKIAVLGAAFKPNSDDVRDSPALEIASQLSAFGAEVWVHDPKALANAKLKYPTLNYSDSITEVLEDSFAILHLTEWNQYQEIDPNWAGKLVKNMWVFDGRNKLDRTDWLSAGWKYWGVGI